MRMYSPPSPLYPISVVSKMLNKSERTIRNWAKKNGSFPKPLRHNGKILGWVPEQLDAWIKGH